MIFKLIKYQFTVAILLLTISGIAQELDTEIKAHRLAETRRALNQMRFQTNLNTSNYDIVYNRLELKIDPSVAYIEGDVTAYFKAKENMNQIIFDLADNMVVSQVKQEGSSLSFEQNANDELVITLLETLSTGSLDSLTIIYSGNPLSSGFGSFEQTSHNGHPIIWTLSEPYGAKAWWPCKQDLIDKIDSVDVILTTPRLNPNGGENVAVSNGLEKSHVVNGEFKTTEFNHRYPIPAYLVAIAVTNYSIYNHSVENNGNPFEIVNYVYPENLESAQASTAVTVDIMNLFSEKFGEYPFSEEKYGHAQFGWSGGMEHTTVSFMGNFSRNLIAHELAHQWYGNKVTCGSWQDIWLNEGFATYLSGLVYENLDGEEVFRNWREQVVEYITSEEDGSVHLKPLDTTSVRRIFDGRLSYYKGAMVLHMLRKKLGDETFFAGMKSYLNNPEYAFGYAKTPDFRLEMEAVSGLDLTEFFQDWVYAEGHPSYHVDLANIRNGKILLNISQSQSHESVEYFEAPLPLKLMGYNGEEKEITVVVDQDVEFLEIEVGFLVDQLIIDPDFDLISKENSTSLFEILYPPEIIELAIFPNPIEDILQIQKPTNLQIHLVQIFNSWGQLIYNNDYESSIDLDHYKVGVYFLRLNTSDGIITKTLLKD